jgi:hypothetical protein
MMGARLGSLPEPAMGRDFRNVPYWPGGTVRDAACSWAGRGPEFSSWASSRSTTRAIGSG